MIQQSLAPMTMPVPPDSADSKEMRRYLLTLNSWLENLHLNGLQSTPMTQAQLNNMVSQNDLAQSGKFFFNTDTQVMNKAEVTVAGPTQTLTITVVA